MKKSEQKALVRPKSAPALRSLLAGVVDLDLSRVSEIYYTRLNHFSDQRSDSLCRAATLNFYSAILYRTLKSTRIREFVNIEFLLLNSSLDLVMCLLSVSMNFWKSDKVMNHRLH